MSSAIKEEMNTTLPETPKSVKANLDKPNIQKGNLNNNNNNKSNLNKKNLNNNNNKNINNNKKFNQNKNQQQQQQQQNLNNNNHQQQPAPQQQQQNHNNQQQHHQNKFYQNKQQYHQHSNDNFNKYDDNYQHNGATSNEYNNNPNRPYKIILGQPTLELPFKDACETKKFTGRCRIFVANLPNNTTEEALRKMFEEFGEVSEVYLGKSNFAFVKMDTRKNAETAKNSIDGKTLEGRVIRVRLAAHAAAVRVKNLSNTVTNELLEYAFSYFGEVERAVVITDDRGRSIGEGIVEFARKFSAQNCLKRCSTECFLITTVPKPVFVEPFEQRDEEEGYPEKQINKNTQEFRYERDVGPRFAEPCTFEHEYSVRWMKLIELEKQKREHLDLEISEARKALQEQLEYSRVEHQTKVLREQLREMEERADKFGQLRTTRLDEERRKDEERQKQMVYLRQQEEEIICRTQMQDVSNLRRQENDLRSKANALQNLLDKQEQTIGQVANPAAAAAAGAVMVPPPNEQQAVLFQNRLNFNEQLAAQQQQLSQQPIYNNTGMPMMHNNAMNSGIDFNRQLPVAVGAPAGHQPFANQNPNMANMAMGGMNGPPSFNPAAGRQQMSVGGPPQQNNRFPNNNNNRNFQSHGGIQKRMRRY